MIGKADVLLIFPFTYPEVGLQKLISRLPSLGIGYIAGILRKYKITVEILDMNIERVDLYGYLKRYAKPPRHIGINAATQMLKNSFYIAKICKEVIPDCVITMGGPHPTVAPEEVLNSPFVDFVVRGEGEFSFLELVKGVSEKDILGLSYRNNGKIIHNGSRPFIADLDQIPFPAYELMPMSKYYSSFAFSRKNRVSCIITSRGCSENCTYCASKTMWNKGVRLRSIKNVIEEISYLTDRFGAKEIYIADDTFTLSVQRVTEFCEEVMRKKMRFLWRCNAVARGLGKKALELMKLSGCYLITYGIESADKKILENVNKNISLDEARHIIELTKKAGIDVFSTFMFGNPGETKETMRKTLNFALNTNIDYAGFSSTYPFLGTPLYEWAKENNYLKFKNKERHNPSEPYLHIPTIKDPDIIEKYCKLAYMRFYLRPSYILNRLIKIKFINIKAYFSFFKIIITSLFKDIVFKKIKGKNNKHYEKF